MRAIDTEGLDEQIRCEMCRNPMRTDRGCDGNCQYDEKLHERIMQILDERIKPLPSAQPYTDEQIQKAQEIEQAQLDKAFELGREDAKPQWIPCSERLPEHSGWYIVTKKLTDDGDKAVCLSWYSFHGWEWGENPIAWMPLPSPYQEEGGQE